MTRRAQPTKGNGLNVNTDRDLKGERKASIARLTVVLHFPWSQDYAILALTRVVDAPIALCSYEQYGITREPEN